MQRFKWFNKGSSCAAFVCQKLPFFFFTFLHSSIVFWLPFSHTRQEQEGWNEHAPNSEHSEATCTANAWHGNKNATPLKPCNIAHCTCAVAERKGVNYETHQMVCRSVVKGFSWKEFSCFGRSLPIEFLECWMRLLWLWTDLINAPPHHQGESIFNGSTCQHSNTALWKLRTALSKVLPAYYNSKTFPTPEFSIALQLLPPLGKHFQRQWRH